MTGEIAVRERKWQPRSGADPPNRGIVSLRFPVDHVAAMHRKLIAADIPIVNAPQSLELPPYGDMQMMTARGPCGARLDFFQAV